VRSVVAVIADILEAEAHEMSLVERDHVVQHLTAYATHPSFRDSVGEGRQLHRMVILPIRTSK
jgi:hypothetical protein